MVVGIVGDMDREGNAVGGLQEGQKEKTERPMMRKRRSAGADG